MLLNPQNRKFNPKSKKKKFLSIDNLTAMYAPRNTEKLMIYIISIAQNVLPLEKSKDSNQLI